MRAILSVLAGTVVLGVAGGLAAQEKRPAPRDRVSIDSVLMKRPALGIQLTPTGSLRDTLGVFVTRVTPKGPAETAGIIEGDRIASINGVDLRVNPADAGDSYASGLPSRRLTREVGKLTPGAIATLRVWSGGRIRDVRVTTGRASDMRDRGSFGYFFEGDGPGFIMGQMPHMERMHVPFSRLRDGARVRVIAPSRSRILTEGETILLDEDGEVVLEPSKQKEEAKKKK